MSAGIVTPRPEEMSDLPVRCANLLCGRVYPSYAMPSSRYCVDCEEQRARRESQRRWEAMNLAFYHGIVPGEDRNVQHE